MTTAVNSAPSSDIDWAAFAASLGDVPVITDPPLVKQKSRDFYWYSPILKAQLRGKFGDVVVVPRSEADIVATVKACVAQNIPITVRGAGTGNYGQAMPLEGGVILEMTAMDRIRSLEDGILRVEAGKRLLDLEEETIPQGWEMRFHPSTRRTATIGGFIAGGSTGIGAINYGLLRDRGSVLGLRVVTVEETPRVLELRGDDVLKATHAYGCNGIITECEIPLAPVQPWVDVIAAFDTFEQALDFGTALGHADPIVKKLITPIAAPIPQDHFRPLKPYLPDGKHIVIAMIGVTAMEPFELLAADHQGRVVYRKGPGDSNDVPPLYEFTWNHTTLQVLKTNKEVTYLQTLFGPDDYRDKILHMIEAFGDEVPMHVEFVRMGGRLGCFGLQVVNYTTEERLREIIAYHEAHGCPIFDPHTYILEDGGMKEIDEVQLAFKRDADPKGLLNPGKMRAWWEHPAGERP